MADVSELLELAKKKYDISPAEEKLFRDTVNGEMADYSVKDAKDNDPAHAHCWGNERVLRASRIAWLCTDRQAPQFVTHRGIQIKGARIDEEFNVGHANIPFLLNFDHCKFMADINFRHAQLHRLNMGGTHTCRLFADGFRVSGVVYLRDGFKAEGEVSLIGANIAGDLDCERGQFTNKDGKALTADGLEVEGSVLLRENFRAEGEVRLVGARIGGGLDCNRGQFINKGRIALNGYSLKIEGSVLLCDGFKAVGSVSFVAARIERDFRLTGVDSPELMTLDLTTTEVGTLYDNQDSWPAPGRLVLHGLEYKEISRESRMASKSRIKWLRRQDGFWPQPYEQLAKVLRESGDDTSAKDVLIAKNEDKAKLTKLTRSQWLWYRLLGPRIGYGHRPLLAMPWALAFILVGWGLFALGYSRGLITPPGDSAYTTTEKFPVPDPGEATKGISTAYPVFNSLVYSIDVFVPVVDFHQANYWLPNANRGDRVMKIGPWPLHTGGVLLFWLWAETVLGWVLSTLFLAGLTGLVRT